MVRSIFIIDDDTSILKVLRHRLESEGYSVTTAESIVELLERATAPAPDLILLDVMMPWMSGLNACSELKALFPDCPVIVVSALSRKEDIERGLRSGADDYFTKPFDMTALCERIEQLINRRSKQRLDDR